MKIFVRVGQAWYDRRQNDLVSEHAPFRTGDNVSTLGRDFWSDFYGAHTEHDLALAQTLRTVRAIRGPERSRARVQRDVRAALSHLTAAMEGLVEWMEQEQRTDTEALQLIDSLRKLGDGVVRCLSACPLELVLQKESGGFE